jgi:hypothetical protein
MSEGLKCCSGYNSRSDGVAASERIPSFKLGINGLGMIMLFNYCGTTVLKNY